MADGVVGLLMSPVVNKWIWCKLFLLAPLSCAHILHATTAKPDLVGP